MFRLRGGGEANRIRCSLDPLLNILGPFVENIEISFSENRSVDCLSINGSSSKINGSKGGELMKVFVFILVCLVLGVGAALFLVRSDEQTPIETAELTVATPSPVQEKQEAPKRPLLDFDDVPLSEIVRALNRSNATQIEIADPAIGEMRITASLRSDNSDGFVNLVEITMGLRAERVSASRIVLHLKDGP